MKKLLALTLLICATVHGAQSGGGHPSGAPAPKAPLPDCEEVICIFV